jgi:hypothetical protein
MKFYKLSGIGNPDTWFETLTLAHMRGKELGNRHTVRIELVEVPSDKVNVCGLLNQLGWRSRVEKTYQLTSRGGLIECPNGE